MKIKNKKINLIFVFIVLAMQLNDNYNMSHIYKCIKDQYGDLKNKEYFNKQNLFKSLGVIALPVIGYAGFKYLNKDVKIKDSLLKSVSKLGFFLKKEDSKLDKIIFTAAFVSWMAVAPATIAAMHYNKKENNRAMIEKNAKQYQNFISSMRQHHRDASLYSVSSYSKRKWI